eukprot:scaffold122021_cov63-Phaeocystis_antarctica.AAC.1
MRAEVPTPPKEVTCVLPGAADAPSFSCWRSTASLGPVFMEQQRKESKANFCFWQQKIRSPIAPSSLCTKTLPTPGCARSRQRNPEGRPLIAPIAFHTHLP